MDPTGAASARMSHPNSVEWNGSHHPSIVSAKFPEEPKMEPGRRFGEGPGPETGDWRVAVADLTVLPAYRPPISRSLIGKGGGCSESGNISVSGPDGLQ